MRHVSHPVFFIFQKLFLLLVSSWLIVIVHSEIVSEMLSDMYSKLDPNAPNEERKKFYSVSTVDGSSLCPEGQFKDSSVGGRYGQDYCFSIPQLPLNSRGRQRIPVTDDRSQLVGCDNSISCLIVRNTFSTCDKTTGYKYKEYSKDVDGICIKCEGVAYVYSEIYNNLPSNTPIEEKKKYLPVSYGNEKSKECYSKKPCGEGEFCGEIDSFPNKHDRFDRFCYNNPKLPDSNNEGPIIISKTLHIFDGLPICNQNKKCYVRQENGVHTYHKCFLKTGLKFVGGYEEIDLYDGICIKANPIALILSDIYLKLNDEITYEERRKYFPVDYKGLADSTVLKNCSMNKECADGQFCGTAYDYAFDAAKRNGYEVLVRYCFTIPHFPDSHNIPRVIPIVPDKSDMELCDNSVRCKADEHWRCDIETGMKFAKEKSKYEKKLYDGICVKEHPVAFVFSEQYKNLNDDVAFDERKKYFPVNYQGFTQNILLKKCSINSDCGDGQFCGTVYDSTDNAPKQNVYYCFAIPQFPDLNGLPRIVALIPTEKDLVLCDSDSDCNVWRCDLATGQKFVEEKTKSVKNGICEKAPPVAYVFSEIYLNLASDATYEEKKKYFPNKYDSASDECTSHSNCDANKFCGAILDFTTNLPKNRYYCFDLPQLPELNNGPKIAVKAASNNLVMCNQNSDCVSDELWKCDLEFGLKFAGEIGGKRELFNGVCIKAPLVALVFSDTYLKLNADVSYEEKRKFFACQSINFRSYCVLNKAFNNVNLCCHRETQPCKMGKLVGPAVRCGKNEGFKDGIFAECNGGLEKMGTQGEKADKWCDEGNNQCCQDQTNDKIQYCPDGQTPLFNEPKCRDYDENVADSGKCIDKIGSICKNGHCCPDVKTDTQGKLIRNKHSYSTNHPCVRGIRPTQFPAGYCEPESGKVVIFGELTPLNETLTRWGEDGPKKCQKDSDCSTDNSTLCIYNEDGYCYYNPMRHVPIRNSNVVIIIVIVIGIIILIASIVGVTVWMLMRKKKNLVKPPAVLKSPSAQTLSKSIESKVSAESVSGMKTPTANSII